MASTVKASSVRAHAESSRTDSQPTRTGSHPQLDGVRAGSHMLRAGASAAVERPDWKAEYASIVQAVMLKHRLTPKEMAYRAGCSETALYEALKCNDGRNIAGHWILAQGNAFVADVQAEVDRRLGLSAEAQRAESFEAIVAVLRAVWFRERRTA